MSATQIDPAGCGCTECLTGEYVPLNQATADQVVAMLYGDLSNATGEKFSLTTVIADFTGAHTLTATIAAEYSGLTWQWPGPISTSRH